VRIRRAADRRRGTVAVLPSLRHHGFRLREVSRSRLTIIIAEQLAGPPVVLLEAVTRHPEKDDLDEHERQINRHSRPRESGGHPIADVRNGGRDQHAAVELVVLVVNVDEQCESLLSSREFREIEVRQA